MVQDGECLLTTYSKINTGYGQVGWHDEEGRRRMALTHRVAWVVVNGPLPDRMTIDHICKRRSCIRPDHLRLATNQENARDFRPLVMTPKAIARRERKRKTPNGDGWWRADQSQ